MPSTRSARSRLILVPLCCCLLLAVRGAINDHRCQAHGLLLWYSHCIRYRLIDGSGRSKIWIRPSRVSVFGIARDDPPTTDASTDKAGLVKTRRQETVECILQSISEPTACQSRFGH